MQKYLMGMVLYIFLFFLFIISIYLFIDNIFKRDVILKLEKYELLKDEKIIKEFTYDKKNYQISIYYDDTSVWSHVNILTKNSSDYYILKNIKKCDISDDASNIYVYNDTIYIHCIGQEGYISEYTLNKYKVEEYVRDLNYVNTPNISQIHLAIDKVDENYIYLSSFKIDNTLEEGDKVKCSLTDNMCSYY